MVGEPHLGKTGKADLPELAVGPLAYLTYDLGQDSICLLFLWADGLLLELSIQPEADVLGPASFLMLPLAILVPAPLWTKLSSLSKG